MGIDVKLKQEAAWKATLNELELQMTRATFQWLRGAKFISAEHDVFKVTVESPYGRDWLNGRLKPTIEQTLSAIVDRPCTVEIGVPDKFNTTPAVRSGNGHVNGNGRVPEPPEEPKQERPWTVHKDGYGGNLTPEQRGELMARLEKRANKNGTTGSNHNAKQINENDDVSIKTRKKKNPLKADVRPSHYAIRFWMPLLGSQAFNFLLLISSYDYELREYDIKMPKIELLGMKTRGGINAIRGRKATGNTRGQIGIVDVLREHLICDYYTTGYGRGTKHVFHSLTTVDELPILTPRQVAELPPAIQEEHASWLSVHGWSIEEWHNEQRETLIEPFDVRDEEEEG